MQGPGAWSSTRCPECWCAKMSGAARVRPRTSEGLDRTIEPCRGLLTERGEVSGARLAAEVVGEYQRLTDEQVNSLF